jgi:hypothetical protein
MSFLFSENKLGTGFGTDVFGRLKVSQPLTIFNSSQIYVTDTDQFNSDTGVNGTVTYDINQSSSLLNVTTESGSYAYRESRRVFAYQPGKSLQVMQTFVMNAPKANLRQRAGYFSTENGIYLETDGTTVYIVKRSYISGQVVNTRVAQSSWNIDKFDGTGPSGVTLDISKAQILVIEFEWLGVGSVKVGFAYNADFYLAHRFDHANIIDSVYMTSASLPVRYEIENTGITASSSTMKQICVTVLSNGGFEPESRNAPIVARRTTEISVTTSFTPIVTIRLRSTRLNSVVVPTGYDFIPTATGNFELVLIRNATLTGANYNTTDFDVVDYDTAATALSGGTIIETQYLAATTSSRSATSKDLTYNFGRQLGRTIAGVSDTITLAARVLNNPSANAIGSISFNRLA